MSNVKVYVGIAGDFDDKSYVEEKEYRRLELAIEKCAKIGKVAASCPPNSHCKDIRCDRDCRIGRKVEEAIRAMKDSS